MNAFAFFNNPHAFMKSSASWAWIFTLAGSAAIAWGVYAGLYLVPSDFRQYDAARIMFIHVPAMWLTLFAYAFMAGASLISFVWRSPLADVCAKSAAPIGATYAALGLIAGSIWGKPIWNTWWEWDGRTTSVLILFFIYLAYVAIWQAMETQQKAARAAAILCLVGVVNLPIIHFSVDWWSTLHQKSSFLTDSGPERDSLAHALGVDQAGAATFVIDASRDPAPARQVKLEVGDQITSINGYKLDAASREDLHTLVRSGEAMEIGFTRKGEALSSRVKAKVPIAFKAPMYIVALGYLALFGGLTLFNMRAEIFRRRAESLVQRRLAAGA